MKIKIYATDDNGDGYSQLIGIYEDWAEITLRPKMFAPDIAITFDVVFKPESE